MPTRFWKRGAPVLFVLLALICALVPLAGQVSAAGAAASSAAGAQAIRPTFVNGILALSALSGQAGVPISEQASGCGFASSSSISVTIYTSGNVLVATPAVSNLVEQFYGCFHFAFTIPGTLSAGTYTVHALGSNGNIDSAQVTITNGVLTPVLQLSSNTIASGQALTGQACGFPNALTTLHVTISGAVTVSVDEPATPYYGCYLVPIPTGGLPIGSFIVTVSSGVSYSASASLYVNTFGGNGDSVVLSANNIYAGQTVTATACHFTAGLQYLLVTVTNAYNVSFSAFEAVTTTINGCYIVTVPTTGLATGSYTVTVSNGSIDSASAPLYVSSSVPGTAGTLTLNSASASPGTLLTATGCGFSASDSLSLFISAAGSLVGATAVPIAAGPTLAGTSGTGTVCFTVQFYVPTGLVNGTYYLYLKGSLSGTVDSTVLSVIGSPIPGSASLAVSPSTVAAGSSITLTGSGFYPNVQVTISGLGVTQVQSSAAGTFTAVLSVPVGTAAGSYTISAVDSLGRGASTMISVTATPGTIQLSAGAANSGQPVTVTGRGFGVSEQLTITLSTAAALQSAVAGTAQLFNTTSNGTFTALYQVQYVAPGQYYLIARGLASGIVAATPFTVLAAPTATATVPVLPQPPSLPLPAVDTAATTHYFAAGYTGTIAANGKATYSEHLYFYNPGATAAAVTTNYSVLDPATNAYSQVSKSDTVAAGSTVVRSVNTDVGADRMVSIVVQASSAVAAEEVVTRTDAAGAVLDAASSPGSSKIGTNWYLAEGYTGATFQEYVTIFNPGSSEATAQIQYLPSDTAAPAAVSQVVPAHGQVTINVRSQYNQLAPSGSKNISVKITADTAVAVDRELYWGDGVGSAKYGYSIAPAIAAGSTTQYFASLATSGNSQSFIATFNPTDTAAAVSLRLLNASGALVNTLSATVRPHARYTFVLSSATVGTSSTFTGVLSSTIGVIAEASLYFGGSPNIGQHPGTVEQGSGGFQMSARADGLSAGGLLYIFNSGSSSVRVQVTSGSLVVSDTLVPPSAVRVVQLSSAAASQGVLVRSSGSVAATLIEGGVAGGPVWGGTLG